MINNYNIKCNLRINNIIKGEHKNYKSIFFFF